MADGLGRVADDTDKWVRAMTRTVPRGSGRLEARLDAIVAPDAVDLPTGGHHSARDATDQEALIDALGFGSAPPTAPVWGQAAASAAGPKHETRAQVPPEAVPATRRRRDAAEQQGEDGPHTTAAVGTDDDGATDETSSGSRKLSGSQPAEADDAETHPDRACAREQQQPDPAAAAGDACGGSTPADDVEEEALGEGEAAGRRTQLASDWAPPAGMALPDEGGWVADEDEDEDAYVPSFG